MSDTLRLSLFLIHSVIIGGVCVGWMAQTRVGLLAYCITLNMIAFQWLVNGGSSVVSNVEAVARSGRWRDGKGEGEFFKFVLASAGIHATTAQVNTGVLAIMFMLWLVALFRMMVTI